MTETGSWGRNIRSGIRTFLDSRFTVTFTARTEVAGTCSARCLGIVKTMFAFFYQDEHFIPDMLSAIFRMSLSNTCLD